MRKTSKHGLTLYDKDDKMSITAKENSLNANMEIIDGALEKPFNPIDYTLPILYLNGDTTGISKDDYVALTYTYGERSGDCELKWQGSSSVNMATGLGKYGKFNYTIKFDNKFEAVEGWGEQKKYCLKANFIDSTHARNVVCAKLWGQMVKSRATANATLNKLPNGGAIDGFPCIVMLNGEFHGLYTWNIPKDGWMFGMSEGDREAIVGADESTALDVAFKGTTLLDGNGIEFEYAKDEDNTGWIIESLNTMINACINSDGTDLDTVVSQYLDLDSVIDYFLFTTFIGGADMMTRNYLLATFDGVKWYMSAYDMDSTMGLQWDGKYFFGVNDGPTPQLFKNKHRAMEVVCRYKPEAIRLRWAQLRNGILSKSNINQVFENFVKDIPEAVYIEDLKRWQRIPSTGTNSLDQILRWVDERLPIMDSRIEALLEEVESDGPNIYNGISELWGTAYFADWKATLNLETLELSNADASPSGTFNTSKGVQVKPNTEYKIPSGFSGDIFAYNSSGTYVSKLTPTATDNNKIITTNATIHYVVFSLNVKEYTDWQNFYIKEKLESPNLFNGISDLWGKGYFFHQNTRLNVDSLEITMGTASKNYNTSKAVCVEPDTDYVIPNAPNTSVVSFTANGDYDGTIAIQSVGDDKVIHTKKSTGYVIFCFYTPTYTDYENFFIYKK